MEPKELDFFMRDTSADVEHRVVKIIFEHWNNTPNFRKAILANELPFKFDKVVLIVRDPRDEMISRLMYFVYPWIKRNGFDGNEGRVKSWLSFIEKVEENPVDYTFRQIIEFMNVNFSVSALKTPHVLSVYRNFCSSIGEQACLLKYEDFIKGNFSGLEAYLGFPLAKESGLDSQHRTRRSATFNNWKELFKPEDVEFFRSHLGDLMDKQGYTDWELEPADKLEKENYSGYLRRILSEYIPPEKKSFFGFLRS